MRINTQNMFWMHTARRQNVQNTFSQFLPGSARTANTQKTIQQKSIYEKASVLVNGGQAKDIDIGLENSGPAELSSLFVDKKNIPAKAAQKIDDYYQTAGALTDGITYKETRLKYLLSEYEKMSENGSEKQLEKMEKLIESEYQDMSGLLKPAADMLFGEIHLSEKVYGKEFTEEYRKLLGDIPDQIRTIADGLKDAGSAEEALEQLAAAKERLGNIAEELAGRYHAYTGKELPGYQYKAEADYQESVKSYGLLWSWDEVAVDTSHVENLADYGVDVRSLSSIPEAVNLIDTTA